MQEHKTREARKGFPYARARHTGGGCFICFAFYATRQETEDVILQLPEGYPKQFVVHFPHLVKDDQGEIDE